MFSPDLLPGEKVDRDRRLTSRRGPDEGFLGRLTPAREYEECQNKARAVLRAFDLPKEGCNAELILDYRIWILDCTGARGKEQPEL